MITNLLNCRQYVTNLTYSFVLKQAENSLQNILAFSDTVVFDRSQSCRHSGLSLMSDKPNSCCKSDPFKDTDHGHHFHQI